MPTDPSCPAADLLVRRLIDHGVRHIFGYPGGQLTPIYDALYRQSSIRHYLARHEQAAAFMADGFARATGRPGVCLAVCGPGVFNAATPLATSYTDSIPVLLISGQVPREGRPLPPGPRSGHYHENDQAAACATITKRQIRVADPTHIVAAVDQAWTALTSGRPGPVLLEVPVDILRTLTPMEPWPALPSASEPLIPPHADIQALARLVNGWQRPLILAGGGVVTAGAENLVASLAERLGAPVLHTANGKCALSASHPLAAGMTWRRATSDLTGMEEMLSPLFRQADGLLALGCRFSQLATGTWTLHPPPLAQIDIDPEEIGRHYPVAHGVVADLGKALEALLPELPTPARPPWAQLTPEREPWTLPGFDLVPALRRALPEDAILSADVTRSAYILMARFPLFHPRTFLHPAGSVAMGYGLPAALGAKAAFPERKVVVVVGDGGFQMSALELASAVQEKLPVVIVLVNDSCLTLIKATQQRRYAERYIGVDLQNPDFSLLTTSFGALYERVDSEVELETALKKMLEADQPGVIEIRLENDQPREEKGARRNTSVR